MTTLKKITIEGYKSIRQMSLELRPLNVLIGANGAGKSNFVSFFKLLNEMMGKDGGRLQTHVATAGGASSLLHYGAKKTPQLEGALEFTSETGESKYYMRLAHAARDSFIFADEQIEYRREGHSSREPLVSILGAGHRESGLHEAAESEETARVIRSMVRSCRVFQFHDTSERSAIRCQGYVNENRFLRPDASNLAAMLYRFSQNEKPVVYRRIVDTLQQIAPWFDDFAVEPLELNENYVLLNWRERYSDMVFGPHQLSDGTLRAMALVTLLQQPVLELPPLVVLDEPELGLHPSAIVVLAALLKKASYHCQVIVATQSTFLLDQFEPEDVVVVDRDGPESTFKRLDSAQLDEWLAEYSLSELWEKNVLGGGPA